jgi:hypothetical protein
MFDFKKSSKNSVPRPTLYCVWIPAYPDKDTPLIRVWIDPSMSMFESQATIHEPDLAAARAESGSPNEVEACGDDAHSRSVI